MEAQYLFERLWQDYVERLCPSAKAVHHLLTESEPLINDHIALRTFATPKTGLDVLAAPFEKVGYYAADSYRFESKKLNARHFEHQDKNLPKVFISELCLDECTTKLRDTVFELIEQIPQSYFANENFLWSGRPWELDLATYQALAEESEYAAWVAAHGYGANHFTVSVNQLNQYDEVEQVNSSLTQHGFSVNQSGGEVKGSPDVYLEQSATMADRVPVLFERQEHLIPGGFYEFAKRYIDRTGDLYQGFVEASADKIFESTDLGK